MNRVLEKTVDGSPSAVVTQAIEAAGDAPIMALPSIPLVRAAISAVEGISPGETIRLVAPERVMKAIRDEFGTAGQLATLVEQEAIAFRVGDEADVGAYLASESGYTSFTGARAIGDEEPPVIGLAGDDANTSATLHEQAEALWEAADEFRLRTPPLGPAIEGLGEEVGEGIMDDLEEVLASDRTARMVGTDVDVAIVLALLTARNSGVLYDLGNWAENFRVASKATFSRKKGRLEDLGLIETEKVHQEVGRPRQRLVLSDDLEGLGPVELVTTADSVLD
jgi:hypothetical protein